MLWLTNQNSLRRKHYAAVHVWQGDPFHKELQATDEVTKCIPRSNPAGPLSDKGVKNWRKEIYFQLPENNIRNFIFGRLKKIKGSVEKKVLKDNSLQRDIKMKMEIWSFVEEVARLTIVELLEWDWENPDFKIFSKCYNNTL